jgi:dUTP pyrophosphatase
MHLQIQRLRPTAKLPTLATPESAGYDLYAALDAPITIPKGEIRRIPIGIAVAPDSTEVALFLMARSGLATKHGITMANGVGLIDSDYRGELMVPLLNLGQEHFTVQTDMRIAQLVIVPIVHPTISCVTQLPETIRGVGGFGSTGQ